MKTQYDTSTRLASQNTCHNVVQTSLRFYYYLSGYSLEDWVNNHNNYYDNDHHYHGHAVAQRLVTPLSLGMLGFSPSAVHTGFVVDKVEV
jgi:hypothetical protein